MLFPRQKVAILMLVKTANLKLNPQTGRFSTLTFVLTLSLFTTCARERLLVSCVCCVFQVHSLMDTPLSAQPVLSLLTFVIEPSYSHCYEQARNTQTRSVPPEEREDALHRCGEH